MAGIRLGVPFTRARFANLLEDPGKPARVQDGAIVVPYRPHEIITLVVE
jgi:hypothetical protein